MGFGLQVRHRARRTRRYPQGGTQMTPDSGPQPTPSQTVGPFFHDALLEEDRSELISPDHPGAIRIEGAVYDGAGEPVSDAMVEIWQANQPGRHDDPEDDPKETPQGSGAFSG